MVILGVMMKHHEDLLINNVGFFDHGKQMFVTCTSIDKTRENMLYVYSKFPSQKPIIGQPFRLKMLDLPGCFEGIGNMLSLRDDTKTNRIGILQLTRLGLHIPSSTGLKKLVSTKITSMGAMVMLFLIERINLLDQTILLVLNVMGLRQAIHTSKRGEAMCMAMSHDESTVYLGYKTTGIIEVFNLKDLRLIYKFKAHVGDVNSIRENTTNHIISSGSDHTLKHYRLTGAITGMDFTRKEKRVVEGNCCFIHA